MMDSGAFGENFPYVNFHDLNLDWILKTIKENLGKEDTQEEQIIELQEAVNDLQDQLDNFDTTFIQQKVLEYLESTIATMIFVELADSGYIVYHIPDGWENIVFNTTGLDIELSLQPQYGHLILSY